MYSGKANGGCCSEALRIDVDEVDTDLLATMNACSKFQVSDLAGAGAHDPEGYCNDLTHHQCYRGIENI